MPLTDRIKGECHVSAAAGPEQGRQQGFETGSGYVQKECGAVQGETAGCACGQELCPAPKAGPEGSGQYPEAETLDRRDDGEAEGGSPTGSALHGLGHQESEGASGFRQVHQGFRAGAYGEGSAAQDVHHYRQGSGKVPKISTVKTMGDFTILLAMTIVILKRILALKPAK